MLLILNRIILKILSQEKKLCRNFGFGTFDFSRLFVFNGCEIGISQSEFNKSEIETNRLS